jgi:DNA-binding NtrC family response regulator
MRNRERPKILCVLHSPSNRNSLPGVLRSARYEVISAFTADQAVAFCINHVAAAVVLDSEFFSERGWSVLQTFKSLCPKVPILLFVEDHQFGTLPQNVDAIANTAEMMLVELRRFFDRVTRQN